jgi:hypothetical protein
MHKESQFHRQVEHRSSIPTREQDRQDSLVTKCHSICGFNKTVAFGRPKVQKLTTMRFGHKRASMIAPFTVLQRRAKHG